MSRVLVVGHGAIGKVRAKGLVALGGEHGASLAGTVDPTPRPADAYGASPHYASIDEVPVSSFDAAILAVPHHLAMPLAQKVLGAGKPVLIEKPLGLDAAEARALVDASRESKSPSFVGYNYRFLPNVRAAFARVKSGALGKLRSVDMLLGHGGHPGSASEWKLKPEHAGGGVLIDPGVHLLDLLLEIVPDVEPIAIASSTGFWGTGVEEDMVAVLGGKGFVATVRSSHIRWVNTFRVEIVGEDGYALCEGRGGTYGPLTIRFGKRWAWKDSGRGQRATEETIDLGDANPSFDHELASVLASWRDPSTPLGDPHPCTFPEGLKVAELTSALYARMRAVS